MPRVADPGNVAGQEKTAKWRKENRERRRPEIDAVDTALAAAVSVIRWTAEKAKAEKAIKQSDMLEQMAVNFLVSKGYDKTEADRRVRRRVRRWDVEDLIPLVNGSPKDSATVSKPDGLKPAPSLPGDVRRHVDGQDNRPFPPITSYP